MLTRPTWPTCHRDFLGRFNDVESPIRVLLVQFAKVMILNHADTLDRLLGEQRLGMGSQQSRALLSDGSAVNGRLAQPN